MAVSTAIHPNDYLLHFIANHPALKENPVEHYLASGRHSAENMRDLMRAHSRASTPSVFEFASGYGCMTRHMGETVPHGTLTACDIHEEAVAFVRDTIGVNTLISNTQPELLAAPGGFDVVCAVSFFSHMPDATWRRWLKALIEQAAVGGIVIFTTHGEKSPQIPGRPVDADGYAFQPISEQGDLEGASYGTTITTFDYVYRQIQAIGAARLIRYHQAFWWGHQDAYVLERT